MNNYIGYFATSLAGHDKGLTYVITGVDDTIKDKISRNIKLTNEDIKLAIKKYNNR